MRFFGELVNLGKTQFEFPRDPKDAKFVELAIAGDATHIITGDKDLLSLPTGHGDAAKGSANALQALRLWMLGRF
jgi:predicted nucleic acid-binding protein